ncbi:MAG: Aerotolerance regulator N-terminal [Bacteroidetes bacterium HLUCCA01]|nr:MAG: Aerotolerance regulator N-terminal [Bacteroidetes bacterium HLUCCA01]
MTFLAPLFLAALAAILIPIAIHLINFRKPRKVAFSTLAFFQELRQSTLRRLKFKRWLLLLIRSLAVILLALALARPYMQGGNAVFSAQSPVLYGVLIDNSMGMTRIDADGPLLDQARELVLTIIDQARDQDRFLIYNTHGSLIRGGLLTPVQARNLVRSLEAGPYGSSLPERYEAMVQALREWSGGSTSVYWVGPGTAGSVQGLQDGDLAESGVPVTKVVLGRDMPSNTRVGSVSLEGAVTGAGVPFTLEAEVINTGQVPVYNHFVSLEVRGRLAGQYQADLEPGEVRRFLFEVTADEPGDLTGRILLEGDAFSADNSFYFSVQIPESRRVLLVSDAGREAETSYIESVLRAGERTRAQLVIETISTSGLAGAELTGVYDAVVLNEPETLPDGVQEKLQQYVQAGNGLVFFPSERGSITSYNRFFNRFNAGEVTGFTGSYGSFSAVTRIGRITRGHPVFEQIFQIDEDEDEIRLTQPSLYYYLRYQPAGSTARTILRSELNDPLLIEHAFGNGTLMLNMLGASPGWSALPGSPLFAPLAYRTVLYAASATSSDMLRHTLGRPLDVQLPLRGPLVQIDREGDVYRADARVTSTGLLHISYPAVEWTPGIYEISDESGVHKLAVNTDISESDFRALSTQELEEMLSESIALRGIYRSGESGMNALQSQITSAGFGIELWHWFLLAAFLLLLIETLVSRWYKAETQS